MKISACVITKNEEKNIDFYLQSIRPYVDEIILVDTGSTDDTVKIVNRYNVKIYKYQWQNDFAAAKNFALSKASGEWVVFLDADEYFSKESIGNLAPLIQRYSGGYEAFLTKMINVDTDNGNKHLDEFYTVRVFRNLPHIRYIGRIHEQLKSLTEDELNIKIITEDELLVYHTGYGSQKIQVKAKRNLKLLEKEMADSSNPQQYYVYLAEAYSALDDDEQAVHYARIDVASGKKNITYASRSYRILIDSLKSLSRPTEEIAEAINIAINNFSDVPDFYAEYGLLFYEKRDYGNAYIYFKKASELVNTYNGLEPCILRNSVDKLNQLLKEVADQNLRKKGDAIVQEDLLIEQKNKAFFDSVVDKIVKKMQLLMAVLLTEGEKDGLRWEKILPIELGQIVARYHDDSKKIVDANFSIYLSLFIPIIDLHNQVILQRYLYLSEDFSNVHKMKIMELLAEHRIIYDIKSFLAAFSEAELLHEDVCYFVGKSYYINEFYQEAVVCFEKAHQLGVNKRDIKSYLQWLAERR